MSIYSFLDREVGRFNSTTEAPAAWIETTLPLEAGVRRQFLTDIRSPFALQINSIRKCRLSPSVLLASRDWGSLILLTANVGFAYLFVRCQKGEIQLPALPLRSSRKKNPDRSAALINEILKKVHREGTQSPTAKERETLERASRGK